jgi:hypothetical protein
MNEGTQQEWLMQIAAGTDPLTGLAAVPREERPKRKSTVCLAAIVILGLSWLLVRWLLASRPPRISKHPPFA